jgi:ATP/maltotriose-dependent transcriptional regulator MalT
MGVRRFGQAERSIQAVEDFAAQKHDRNHYLNARCLRARLLLQTGDPEEALALVADEPGDGLIPSWKAEYIATRAMALACLGRQRQAARQAATSTRLSRALEVRMLAEGTRAILHAARGTDCSHLLIAARRTGVWDPVICALRASPSLAAALGQSSVWATDLAELYSRTADRSLAKRSGLRIRSTAPLHDLLSPREVEVLELIAKGFRNRQISKALYIADSTTKVHVRHVFEKLGVRNRAEAIARYEVLASRKTAGSSSLAP